MHTMCLKTNTHYYSAPGRWLPFSHRHWHPSCLIQDSFPFAAFDVVTWPSGQGSVWPVCPQLSSGSKLLCTTSMCIMWVGVYPVLHYDSLWGLIYIFGVGYWLFFQLEWCVCVLKLMSGFCNKNKWTLCTTNKAVITAILAFREKNRLLHMWYNCFLAWHGRRYLGL